MEIPSKIVQLLMEVGYLAGGNGMPKQSELIFEALQTVRPESEYPLIGQAVTRMNVGKPDEAAKILFDKALNINPESDLAKSFLGLAFKLAGMQSASENILKEVLVTNRDPQATDIAKSVLAEM